MQGIFSGLAAKRVGQSDSANNSESEEEAAQEETTEVSVEQNIVRVGNDEASSQSVKIKEENIMGN